MGVLSIAFLLFASPTFAGTLNLPRTGQTKCYDSSGIEIPCAGTGQDGEIQAGMRKKYHIKPGTEMQIMEYGGIIYLIPPVDNPVKTACGILPSQPSLAKQLLKERKSEFK